MLIGYARVSTQDQNLELQCKALIQAGCQKVFEDKLSGTRANSPDLAKALEMLREGDTLVVWKLDRLGHSVKQLVDLVSELRTQGIQFRSLTDSIDTSTPPAHRQSSRSRSDSARSNSLHVSPVRRRRNGRMAEARVV